MTTLEAPASHLAEVMDLATGGERLRISFADDNEDLVRDWALTTLTRMGVPLVMAATTVEAAQLRGDSVRTDTGHADYLLSIGPAPRPSIEEIRPASPQNYYRLYSDNRKILLSLTDGADRTIWIQDDEEPACLARAILDTIVENRIAPIPGDSLLSVVPHDTLLLEVAIVRNRVILSNAQAAVLAMVSLDGFQGLAEEGVPASTDLGEQTLFLHTLLRVLGEHLNS